MSSVMSCVIASPFMSSAPRPQTYPSCTTPENGATVQYSGLASTTSIWLRRMRGRALPSPLRRAYRFAFPAWGSNTCASMPSRASTAFNQRAVPSSLPGGFVVLIATYCDSSVAASRPTARHWASVRGTSAQWRAVGREAATLLSQYVAINTTNPPGNELGTARWLKAVLARDGIEAQVFEPQAGKANLYARLKGDGSARPLILLNHMDVVLASPEYWTVAPFSGVVQDGYVWGRGALDMKGEAIAQLMTLLTLKRAGVPLKRDVIFLATADEEIGGGVGAA